MKANIFRISELLSDELKRIRLKAVDAKVLLALLYLDERQPKYVWNSVSNERVESPRSASVAELRELGLCPRSSSSRFLRQPIRPLIETGLFDVLDLTDNGKGIYWKFSNKLVTLMGGEIYGMIAADEISNCTSVLDAVILTQTAVRMNMLAPAFSLFPFESASTLKGIYLINEETFTARDMTRTLRPALEKWASLRRLEYFVEYTRRGGYSACSSVRIKFRHSKTKWGDSAFFASNASSHKYCVGELK